jgi:pyruvate dehydrogenase E2 component (dihydrolipoyllysine-residue acetyltransferase)
MPSLGADMEAGTLVEWRVHVGDSVKSGDIVAEVETEKGLIEVEIFDTGVIETILVHAGEKVPVGTPLATVRSEKKPVSAAPVVAPQPAVRPPAVAAKPAPAPPPPSPTPVTRPRVSPLARTRAAALGVDVATVSGTGEAGAVTVADVERAASRAPAPAAPPRPAVPTPDQQAAMRRAIAAAMARSKREIPHYYLATQIDMHRALAWLAAENAKRPVTSRLLYSVLLLRAVALAVHEVPEVNGYWVDGAFQPGSGVHVGVAISLRTGGLVAPAIHDVDKQNLDALMQNLLDLVKRARAGVLRSSEIADATVTVTNLGEQGIETVFGVIYPPQVALVGFGKLVEQPRAVEGMIGTRPVITATLSADHRASDGHRGGRFLAAIERLLQEPEKL